MGDQKEVNRRAKQDKGRPEVGDQNWGSKWGSKKRQKKKRSIFFDFFSLFSLFGDKIMKFREKLQPSKVQVLS